MDHLHVAIKRAIPLSQAIIPVERQRANLASFIYVEILHVIQFGSWIFRKIVLRKIW